MLEFLKNKNILVVVAHPDDEVIGLGATMNLLICKFNATIQVVILGEGITSRGSHTDPSIWEEDLKIHHKNIEIAQKHIGYKDISLHKLPDNQFDSIPLLTIIKIIEAEKERFRPDVIFTHHGGDLNIDHQRTFEAVVTSCRPLKDEHTKSIITFETLSGTEWQASTEPKQFVPNFFVSISAENLNAKIAAMESYIFEKRIYPHPRSPEALKIVAQRWGLMVGTYYAEAFCLVRNIS